MPAPWAALPIVLGVALPLVAASATGSLDIPHNDDWAYSRIAETFGRTGHVELVGWNRMFLLGQVVVLGPLGRSVVAQHLFVACTGALALGATYAFLRPRIGSARAVAGAAVLAAWPGFGLLATSFMTDVPSYAAMLCALALGDAARRRGSRPLLAAALLVALWGTTIREQAAAALIAVAAGALRARDRRAAIPRVLGASLVAAALEAWRRSLPDGDSPPLHLAGVHYASGQAVHSFFTLAAPLLPFAVAVRPSTWRPASRAVAALVAVGGAALAAGSPSSFLIGNYLTPFAAYREASTGAPRLLPGWTWNVVVAAAVVSAALLAGALAERAATLDLLTASFTAASLVFLAVELAFGQPLFDRDLIVFLPACAIVCLSGRTAPLAARTVPALVATAALGGVILVGTLAYDGARWRAAGELRVAPTDVDAGLEWMGAHGKVPVRRLVPGDAGFEPMFPASRNCHLVTGPGAAPVGTVVRRLTYSWLVGRETLLVSRRC
jgi:hypothetical protein